MKAAAGLVGKPALTLIVIFMLSQAPFLAFAADGFLVPGNLLPIMLAVGVVVAGILTRGAQERSSPRDGAWSLPWPIVLGFVWLLAIELHVGEIAIGIMAHMFAAVVILCFLSDRAGRLLERIFGMSTSAASSVVLVLFAIAGSAPVWFGPWVIYFDDHQWLTNATVAISPVSYLANLAEVDYLRSSWFYEHTPYGGMRFSYASSFTSHLAFITLAVIFWIADKVLSRRTSGPARLSQGSAETE